MTTSPLARLLDAIDPGARAKAAAITGQQSPTVDQLADDSAARAELFGDGDADGPNVEPVYEGERPLLVEVLDQLDRTLRSVLLGSPPPNRVTVYRVNTPADVAGLAVQLVPPAEGRKRRILIQALTGAVSLSGERRDTGDPDTGDVTGYMIDSSVELAASVELFTTGAVFAASDVAYDVRVLIEHYPDQG